jgi:site-specific recombinase XerD
MLAQNISWNRKFNQKNLQNWMFYCQEHNLKPRSINRRLASVRMFYRFCYGTQVPHSSGVVYSKGSSKHSRRESRLGLFKISQKSFLELHVKVPRKVVDPLKPSDVDDFLKDIRRYRDLAIILSMLLCGLRSQEVINLRKDDVDFQQSQLRVMGKGKRERIVPMSLRLMEVFEKYLTYERPLQCCEHFFVILQGSGFGQAMTTAGLRSLFRYRRTITNVAMAKPHQFRHTFASDLARAGTPITTIQRLLGHSDPQTSEIYIELFMEDIRAEYEKAMVRLGGRYAIPRA